jgi:hypothetical protein
MRQAAGLAVGVLFSLGWAGISPAGAQDPTPTLVPVVRAQGSGKITIAPGRFGSFHFDLDSETVGTAVLGQVQFFDPVAGEFVVSELITDALVVPGFVSVEGICRVNGIPTVFQMEAIDSDLPGQYDSFFLCYGDPLLDTCVGDRLLFGNIRIRLDRIVRLVADGG